MTCNVCLPTVPSQVLPDEPTDITHPYASSTPSNLRKSGSRRQRRCSCQPIAARPATPEPVDLAVDPVKRDLAMAQELRTPEFAAWPDAPVALVSNPSIAQAVAGDGPSSRWLRANPAPSRAATEAVEVESELFKGRVAVWLNGLGTTPNEVFQGKKRMSWVAIQGTFKREVAAEDVVTGQELGRPLRGLPARWFVENVLLRIARSISPSMQVGLHPAPFLLSPLLAISQIVNISAPGQEPDIFDAPEDCRLLGACLADAAGAPIKADHRRIHFAKPANLAPQTFRPGLVYTFHIWQQFIDVSTYKLDLGLHRYNLVKHLAGQPLQIMAKHCPPGQDPSYLFNFQMWNKALADDLLDTAAKQQAMDAATADTAAALDLAKMHRVKSAPDMQYELAL